MSSGGKSITAMYSTYPATGTDSEEVPHSKAILFLARGAVVTTPRNDINHVVTEYGIARLRGLNIRERVEVLAKIAHSDLRDWLREGVGRDMIW